MKNTKLLQLGKPPLLMEFFRIPGYYENNFWRIIANLIWGGFLLFVLAILVIIGSVVNDAFLTLSTLKIILTNVLPLGLMASVMIIIFSNGGLDLSVGSVMSLVGIVMALLLQQGTHPVWAIALGLGVALGIGLVNGILVGIAGIPGILVTLAAMFLVRGMSYSISGGTSITFQLTDALLLSRLKIFGWFLCGLVSLVAALLVQFPLLGRKAGLKQPEEARSWIAQACFWGIPYIFSSLLAGFVGLMQTSHVSAGIPTLGTNFEIQVVFAIVLGGSCIGGRFGNVIGALLGALLMTTVHHILTLTNVSMFHQQFLTGILFLIATGLCYGYNGIVGILYRKRAELQENR